MAFIDLQPGDVVPRARRLAFSRLRAPITSGSEGVRCASPSILERTPTAVRAVPWPPWFLQIYVLPLSFVDQAGEMLLNGANGLASHEVKSHGRPEIAVQPVVPLNGRIDAKRVAGSLQGSAGLQACYAQALGAAPELEGTVVFQAKIDGRGRPTDLLVTLEDLGSPDLVTCLGSSLKDVTLAGASPGAQLLLPLELRL